MKTAAIQKKPSVPNIRMLTMTAVLSAIAFVLAFFEFPVPLSPSFARMDLSDLPAPVSYTHLDVYKRQQKASVTGALECLCSILHQYYTICK